MNNNNFIDNEKNIMKRPFKVNSNVIH